MLPETTQPIVKRPQGHKCTSNELEMSYRAEKSEARRRLKRN